MIEGYIDFCMGCLINLDELNWNSGDDFLNNILVFILTPSVFIFPFFCLHFLNKNIKDLNYDKFTQRYGVLYDTIDVNNKKSRLTATRIAFWFMIRRLFSSLNVIYLYKAYSTTMLMQAFNFILLAWIDMIIKRKLFMRETTLISKLEKINDVFVVIVSYFLLALSYYHEETIKLYSIGWFTIVIMALMTFYNISIVARTSIKASLLQIKK